MKKLSVKQVFFGFILGSGLIVASGAFADVISGSFTTNHSTDVTVTQLTITKPSASVGDIMVATIAINGGTSAVVTAPSGWTQILKTDNDTNISLISYWKVVGGSEPSSYTWSTSDQTTAEGGITAYSGVNTSNPIDVSAGNIGFSATATTTPITTTTTSPTILALYATNVGKSNEAGDYFSAPSGMTQKYDTSNTPFGPSVGQFEAVQVAVGSTGSKSTNIAGNKARNWASQIIALNPTPTICTGGLVTTSGGNTIHTFTSDGTFDCTGKSINSVNVLVIGGGGGGGYSDSGGIGNGGGGGAGGVRIITGHAISATSYSITVGNGGAGSTSGSPGTNGSDSIFDTITSVGGGGGGSYASSGSGGQNGGSGGGAPQYRAGGTNSRGLGTSGQGNNGGSQTFEAIAGAGGGGAGAIGGDSYGPGSQFDPEGGLGGIGTTSSITGSTAYYGGGGGGSTHSSGTGVAAGGTGGGGNGHFTSTLATSGTASTGGGGGGGGEGTSGAMGGSGVVIISYPTP